MAHRMLVRPTLALLFAFAAANAEEPKKPTPDEAQARLAAGNERFVEDKSKAVNLTGDRRKDLAANGQHPFATVLACADSRVPVEHLFNQGLGDLFVLRVAGNLTSDHVTGSIDYAAEHLEVPLLVVMGHTKCGAVAAAVSDGKFEGSLGKLVDAIEPTVEQVKKENPKLTGDELLNAAIDRNVQNTMAALFEQSKLLRHLAGKKKVKVVGAVYDIGTGKVRWLGEHPKQAELIKN